MKEKLNEHQNPQSGPVICEAMQHRFIPIYHNFSPEGPQGQYVMMLCQSCGCVNTVKIGSQPTHKAPDD